MSKLWTLFVGILFLAVVFSSSVIATGQQEADVTKANLIMPNQLGDSIEFNGTCKLFLHLLYRTRQNTIINPTENIVKTGFSMIFFKNSEIVINGEYLGQHEQGILLLFHYRGDYELDYEKQSLIIDGQAWFSKVI